MHDVPDIWTVTMATSKKQSVLHFEDEMVEIAPDKKLNVGPRSGAKTRHNLRYPHWTVERILELADAFYAEHSKWPCKSSGPVETLPGESWSAIDRALNRGTRSLPGGSSLPRMLFEHRGVHYHGSQPDLSIEMILAFADAHFTLTGDWPNSYRGTIPDAGGLTWSQVDGALKAGDRSLPGGSSLAKLLADTRGRRNKRALPTLNLEAVLAWAQNHHARTGEWPDKSSGEIPEAPGETWRSVCSAFPKGDRGLRGCGFSTLAGLLMERAGRPSFRGRNAASSSGKPPRVTTPRGVLYPRWTVKQILALADEYKRTHGVWPTQKSGVIEGMPAETWGGVDSALAAGFRGLPGGSSLSQFLGLYRGAQSGAKKPPITRVMILQWADAHYTRCRSWPNMYSGDIPESPGENWKAVDRALRHGYRGLRGGQSLAEFLMVRRPARKYSTIPRLSLKRVLKWADAYFERSGGWPNYKSGIIDESPKHTWGYVNYALQKGACGLPGQSSLGRLLAKERGVRSKANQPCLTVEVVLEWADDWHARTKRWPHNNSGRISDTSPERWNYIDAALRLGQRGLPGGTSLAQLLAYHRGKRNQLAAPMLHIKRILGWADAHYARTKRWPTQKSGPVFEYPEENWGAISAALAGRHRGLPGGTTLARLLMDYRGKRNHLAAPRLDIETILLWADDHFHRTQAWPTHNSGPVVDAEGENWNAIDQALTFGRRGLSVRISLARLLAQERGVPHFDDKPLLSIEDILRSARAHYEETGRWPTAKSGPVSGTPGLTWCAVAHAIHLGTRGLGGSGYRSLAHLLDERLRGGER